MSNDDLTGRCKKHGAFSWDDSPGGCPYCSGPYYCKDCGIEVEEGRRYCSTCLDEDEVLVP